ncbi:MAG TPA: PROX protein, partial [Sulfurospirillum cavolei]
FSIGVAKGSKEPSAAQELVGFLTSEENYPRLVAQGLVPAATTHAIAKEK